MKAAVLSLALLAVNVASVASALGFLHKAKQVKEYDHWRYIEMARGPEGRQDLQREPPYCFRLAVPALARGLMRLGLSENASFYVVTNGALFGFLLLLFLFFVALRAFRFLFWGPRWGWGHHRYGPWGRAWENGVPPMFEEWHKRAHGQSTDTGTSETSEKTS